MYKNFKYIYVLLICGLTACAGNSYDAADIVKLDINSQKVFTNSPCVYAREGNMQRWWENIEDPLLDKYIEDLLADNLSLKQAAMRVIQAKETMNMSGAALLPTASLGASNSRSFAKSATTGNRAYSSSIGADASIAWQIDLFGKLHKTLDAARSSYDASIYDLEALEHSLIAELVKTRVEIAVNKEKLRFYKKMSSTKKQIFNLTKERYDAGVKGLQLRDVYSAEKDYLAAETVLSNARASLTNSAYKLDVLLGKVPNSTNAIAESFPLMNVPRDITIYAPIKLLDRRPDIKASELRVRAGMANIDVAVASLYPSLNIAGSLGFTGNKTKNLLTAENLAASLLTSITATLFDGGSLKANVRMKEAQARELSYKYSEDVIEAFKEVEIALKEDSETLSKMMDKKKSLKALNASERVSKGRYNKGIESLTSYLNAKYKRYAGEVEYLTAEQSKWNARVNLYLALGGDWKQKAKKNKN